MRKNELFKIDKDNIKNFAIAFVISLLFVVSIVYAMGTWSCYNNCINDENIPCEGTMKAVGIFDNCECIYTCNS